MSSSLLSGGRMESWPVQLMALPLCDTLPFTSLLQDPNEYPLGIPVASVLHDRKLSGETICIRWDRYLVIS